MAEGALSDLKVLEFGHLVTAAYCTKMMGDMGARVIKIESMKKMDVIRSLPPWVESQDPTPNNSGYYNWLNRNKMAVSLDLTKDKGLALAKELIKLSDALVENFSRGVMEKFGLD